MRQTNLVSVTQPATTVEGGAPVQNTRNDRFCSDTSAGQVQGSRLVLCCRHVKCQV